MDATLIWCALTYKIKLKKKSFWQHPLSSGSQRIRIAAKRFLKKHRNIRAISVVSTNSSSLLDNLSNFCHAFHHCCSFSTPTQSYIQSYIIQIFRSKQMRQSLCFHMMQHHGLLLQLAKYNVHNSRNIVWSPCMPVLYIVQMTSDRMGNLCRCIWDECYTHKKDAAEVVSFVLHYILGDS